MQHAVVLKANTWGVLGVLGRYVAIIDTGSVADVELRLYRGAMLLEHLTTARRNTKARIDDGFDRVELRSTGTPTVQIVISDGAVDVSAPIATLTDPLPVSNDRGSPGNLLHVAGVTVADAPATALDNAAPVACSATIATIANADATRRALRIFNIGPDPVAIGAAGLTWANRTLVLEAGEGWNEERAANLAWSAITDTGMSASVTTQRVRA